MERLPVEVAGVAFVLVWFAVALRYTWVAWFRTQQFIERASTISGWRKMVFYTFYRYSEGPSYLLLLRIGSVLLLTITSMLLAITLLYLLKKYTAIDPFGMRIAS
jgi:hypothetical protein